MKALSLWQPWASLMMMGLKTIETRSWPTKYRGSLAIHAAKTTYTGLDAGLTKKIEDAISDWFNQYINLGVGMKIAEPISLRIPDLPRGGIIGIVDLVDCSRLTGNILPEEPERSFGDYRPVRYMWFTKDPKPFKKIIPLRGLQGLFNVHDEALRVCRVCGCSNFNACEGGCAWVEQDLCSACLDDNKPGRTRPAASIEELLL